MQITIDADTFHKWATERGYVLASEVIPKIRAALGLEQLAEMRSEFEKFATPAGVQYAMPGRFIDTIDAFSEEAAALEQPEDLKPVDARRLREAIADADAGKLTEFDPTAQPLTDKQTIRLLGELFEHFGNSPEANKACRALLDRYGASKASEIPPEDRAELARLVSRRHDCATADEFIESLGDVA
jgi:hypothetical protein